MKKNNVKKVTEKRVLSESEIRVREDMFMENMKLLLICGSLISLFIALFTLV